MSQTVKNLPVMQETRVRSLGWDMYFVIHDFKNGLPLFFTKVNSRLYQGEVYLDFLRL